MLIRPLMVATALATVLPALAVCTPATAAPVAPVAPAYAAKAAKVTLKPLPASSDVGQSLTIAGTAKPAKKNGKKVPVKVTVQRLSPGATTWQGVVSGKTTKKGTYSFKVALTQGGTTAFRVKRAGGGLTPAESLAVYQWLDLADQPQVLWSQGALLHRTSTVVGRKYPESYEFPQESAYLAVKVAGLCTTMRAAVGILDSEVSQVADGGTVGANLYGYTPDGPPPAQTTLEASVGAAKAGSVDLTGQTFALVQAGNNSLDMDRWSATVLTPQLRCNAAVLPSIEADEVPV